jgi:hypothetical protein
MHGSNILPLEGTPTRTTCGEESTRSFTGEARETEIDVKAVALFHENHPNPQNHFSAPPKAGFIYSHFIPTIVGAQIYKGFGKMGPNGGFGAIAPREMIRGG